MQGQATARIPELNPDLAVGGRKESGHLSCHCCLPGHQSRWPSDTGYRHLRPNTELSQPPPLNTHTHTSFLNEQIFVSHTGPCTLNLSCTHLCSNFGFLPAGMGIGLHPAHPLSTALLGSRPHSTGCSFHVLTHTPHSHCRPGPCQAQEERSHQPGFHFQGRVRSSHSPRHSRSKAVLEMTQLTAPTCQPTTMTKSFFF